MTLSSTELGKCSLKKLNEVAQRALFLYPSYENLQAELLAYSENATYFVRNLKTGEKNILRVCRPYYQTKTQTESELHWIQAIDQETSIDVSVPLPGKGGAFVHGVKLENDPVVYYCTMFTYLEGQTPGTEDKGQLIQLFEQVGEITARLHSHAQKWEGVRTIDREPWDYETILGKNPKWARWQNGMGMTKERKQLFEEVSRTIKRRLEKFGKNRERFGLIHGDLRFANLIKCGETVKVIDFDDCGFSWYLFDLGASLSFIEHKPYVPVLVRAWLKGYRKVKTLSKEEEKEIPTFIMLRRLMLISWIGSRENETTKALGETYTEQTVPLAKVYLKEYQS